MNRWWKAALVLLAVATARPEADAGAEPTGDAPLFEVKPGNLGVAVEEWGILEAGRYHDVYFPGEESAAIVSLLPEGTPVVRGQLVVEVDSSTLKDRLMNQEIATRSAEATYQNAKLDHEVADIAVTEYEQGIYPQASQSIKGEIDSRGAALKRVEDRLERVTKARERLNVLLAAKGEEWAAGEVLADLEINERVRDAQLAVARAKLEIEQANVKGTFLEKYEKRKTTLELRSKVESAMSTELAKQATWEGEKSKEAKLRRQIANCKLYAPGDGPVVYGNRYGPDRQPLIEEGASVRERQKVFSIPDLSVPMRANVKVPEALLDWITPGLPARIKVESFEDENLTGVVRSIARLPDVARYFDRDTRYYTTYVSIENSPKGLALGMAARVEILTTELVNVLGVPVPALVYYDYKDHVAVKKPDGGFDWREVKLGLSTGTMVEVKQGLKTGEAVAIEPAPLLNGGQKLKIALSPPRTPRPPRGISP